MKKIAFVVSLILILLCFSETNFAQKKKKSKKPVRRANPSVAAPIVPPCKEEEVTLPYSYPSAGGEAAPVVVKKPCPVAGYSALKILSRPSPRYTDEARANNITEKVSLKVTFLASGQIGSVTAFRALPYGLTDQAIAAARQIKFEPQREKGRAVSVIKTVEYNFTLY